MLSTGNYLRKRSYHPFPSPPKGPGGFRSGSKVLAALLCLAAAWGSGCHVTPYHRTLPDWVGSVYVPMAVNESFEPGLEELITNAFTMELLSDGRVDVVQKGRSNAVVRVTIRDFEENSDDFDVDDVESVREVNMLLALELFDPSDMENPLLHVEDGVAVDFRYASGIRSIGSLLRVDAMDRLAETTGRQLLHNLMTQMIVFVEEVEIAK